MILADAKLVVGELIVVSQSVLKGKDIDLIP